MNPMNDIHFARAKNLGLVVALVLAGAAVPLEAATIVVEPGPATQLNGWPASTVGMHWQEDYNSSFFGSSPLIIDSFGFRGGQESTVSYGSEFSVTMSTTATAPGALSTTFSSNVGGDAQVVLSGPLTITTTTGDFTMFALTNPFYYDPTQGHLLIEIVHATALSGFGTAEFAAYNVTPSGLLQRIAIDNMGASTGVDSGFGELLTRFDVHNVPEPSAILLAALGLVGLPALYTLRRRRVCRSGWPRLSKPVRLAE